MKINTTIYSILASSLLVISCKKEEAVVASDDKPKEVILPRVQTIPTQNYTVAQQPAMPVQNQQPVPAPQPVTTTVPVTKPGMNPPHGQPGHRCDIAVGAPLNSPVKTQAPIKVGSGTTQQLTPNMITTQTSQPSGAPALLTPNSGAATTTPTAPGMNPPHGQEGHRCDIAVGAPLPKS